MQSHTSKKTLLRSFIAHYKYNGRRGFEPKTGLNPFLKTALNVFLYA